ncbi:MAG: phage integrase N-terminal SAM-like domain-containing protein [Bacteroidetes bacterium]|nr:phage integrase N-terminal SAM-like domain-containing protein [Bacteroidota bacterium]
MLVQNNQIGLLETVRQELRLRNYSYKTRKAYTSHLRSFTKHFKPIHPHNITNADHLSSHSPKRSFKGATICVNKLQF